MISPRAQLIVTLFISQSLRIISMLVMARLIGKADFGYFNLITTMAAFVFVGLGDFSIPSSIVQSRDVEEKIATDTALVLCGGLYIFYGLITVGTGFYLADKYDYSAMIPVSIIIAVTNLLQEIYFVQLARLNRSMRFRAEAFQNIIFALSQTITGIVLALSGWGIYAIAIQQLVGQLIASIVIFRHSPVSWPTQFSMPVARRFIVTGGKISLALYISNCFNNLVTLSFNKIGVKLGGPQQGIELVGIWDRTTKIYAIFTQNILGAFDRVFFTSICAAKDEKHRNKLVIDAMGIYSLITCGVGVLLYVAAPDMVKVVQGQNWLDVIPLLQVLAFAVPAAAFYGVGYATCYSINRTEMLFYSQLIILVLFGSALWLSDSNTNWPTWVFSTSRYFIGLSVLLMVLYVMKISFLKAFSSTLIALFQAIVTFGYVHYSMGPINQLANWLTRLVPDLVMGRHIPTTNIFRFLILSLAVFVMYLMLTVILQPAMGRRLLQLTARKKDNPAPVGGANDLTCSVN